MITSKKSTYYLRLFLDLIILNISFIVSAILAQSFKILMQRNYMLILMTGLNFVWYFVSNVIEFYEDFNTRNFSYQFIKIFKNVIVQILTAVLFIFLVKEDLFTRNFIILYAALLTMLVSVRTQVIKHTIARVRGKEKNVRNVLIIGAGELGRNFFQMISKSNDFGFNLVGFLDDDKNNLNHKNIIG